ncbi:MAG: membrane protein insertion efficiency factor YidD [Spirochaetes bacterium]|nr:membrane protein insertion efficiency factor YidD [Spirochaetota bacterium]
MKFKYGLHRIIILLPLMVLKIYKRIISPFLPKACRYYPTCSEYAAQALRKYGLIKGLFLAVKRILRCNPLFEGGYDPVP